MLRAVRTLPAIALVAALAACAAPAPVASPSADAALELQNCDTLAEYPTAPERVVAIKSTSTEMLLALGLGDRIVGTAFQDGPVPAEYADAAASIPVISEQFPSEEALLELEPDFVFSGWESAFSPDAAGDRAELASLGVATYVAPAACRSDNVPTSIGFDDIFAGIEEVASIFRIDASELIAAQQATLDAIEPVGDGRSALWYSSGDASPYVGAGDGAPELILETIGLENIAGDVAGAWAPLSWEAVVDANPDVIVLVDAAWNTAESKIQALESNPATANLDAVKNKRYLIVPFAASEAGVRSVEAASDLARQLGELDAS